MALVPTSSRISLIDSCVKSVDVTTVLPRNLSCDVCILQDVLWYYNRDNVRYVPARSKVKIAYSMIESTAIPAQWVTQLNSSFDAVVVPDEYFVDVYHNSGVTIPIYVIPLGIYIDEFLAYKKVYDQKPRVFGCSAVNWGRKNLVRLIRSFNKAFGNDERVRLVVHSKTLYNLDKLRSLITVLGATNIQLISKEFSWQEYIAFMTSLDCYVLLSKGEGFSVTPREALAAGIPCIITNNTAHKNICKTGFVRAVESTVEEPAYYEVFRQYCGTQFDCREEDVADALKDMYAHYDDYVHKAQQARSWVAQYRWCALRDKYIKFIQKFTTV
jgi:glycosyltransferase involved in cell wall biosynthesis